VDLINNLDELGEDKEEVLNKVLSKAKQLPSQKLKLSVTKYGNVKTKKLFNKVFNSERAYV
jgi:hypothetical protein